LGQAAWNGLAMWRDWTLLMNTVKWFMASWDFYKAMNWLHEKNPRSFFEAHSTSKDLLVKQLSKTILVLAENGSGPAEFRALLGRLSESELLDVIAESSLSPAATIATKLKEHKIPLHDEEVMFHFIPQKFRAALGGRRARKRGWQAQINRHNFTEEPYAA